jgi:hypothetical protein
LSLHTTAHPLHTRFAQGFGRSIFETAMRLDPGRHRADGGAAVVGVREPGLAQRGGDLARAAVGGVIPNDPSHHTHPVFVLCG